MRIFHALIPVLTAVAISTVWAESWVATPIVVHEWGVQVFDAKGNRELPDLPAFLHTPAALPKEPVTRFSPPVREMEEDKGFRAKPILYFYGEGPVSLDLSFAFGVPLAWYPQADQVCAGFREAPDAATLAKWISDLGSPDFKTREEASRHLAECGPALHLALESALARAEDLEIKARLKSCLEGFGKTQLSWSHLKLEKILPTALELPGKELKADHWVRQARQVDAAYVTNGVEAERYVFYEGRTTERPALLVEAGSKPGSRKITNRSRHAVHDIFLMSVHGEQRHLLFTPCVEAGQSIEGHLEPVTGADWKKASRDRLLSALTAPQKEVCEKQDALRKPCEPQPPTRNSWLFPKEAEALLAIWDRDFFQGEGTRLVYRENVAALDEAMPLALYTDMYHFIQLNRAGLVLVKGLEP